MSSQVSCIFLAAGLGRRFGGDVSKLLQDYHGKAIIAHGLSQLLRAKRQSAYIREILIITGHQNAETEKAAKAEADAADENIKIIYNENYRDGLYTSLLCGIQAAAQTSRYLLVLPADMPNIKASAIETIIAAALKHDDAPSPLAYIPVNKDNLQQTGNPVLLDKEIVPLLQKHKQDSGDPKNMDSGAAGFLRHLRQNQPHKVEAVKLAPDSGAFTDIDEMRDLQKLTAS